MSACKLRHAKRAQSFECLQDQHDEHDRHDVLPREYGGHDGASFMPSPEITPPRRWCRAMTHDGACRE
ncbi:MAG: hypothetical protein E6Q40_06525 [Cupriavidus sp.]|nr:MAG: hypothetical protein E6Q40_06525 [Cupriavidus sp.]